MLAYWGHKKDGNRWKVDLGGRKGKYAVHPKLGACCLPPQISIYSNSLLLQGE